MKLLWLTSSNKLDNVEGIGDDFGSNLVKVQLIIWHKSCCRLLHTKNFEQSRQMPGGSGSNIWWTLWKTWQWRNLWRIVCDMFEKLWCSLHWFIQVNFSTPYLSIICHFCRFRDTSTSLNASSKRYVITNPPGSFRLLPTDQVNDTYEDM